MSIKVKRYIKNKLFSIFRHRGYFIEKSSQKNLWDDPFTAQKELLKDYTQPEPIIFDVGASIGNTVRAYLKLSPPAIIYCFEPYPASIAKLKNRFSSKKQVRIVPYAVAEKSGEKIFYVNHFEPTNSLLPRPDESRRYYPRHAGPKNTITVRTLSLDDFAKDSGIEYVDVLKLDVQGGELMALQGSEKLLQARAIGLIYSEIIFIAHYKGGPLFHHLCSFLDSYDYSLFNIYGLKTAANGQLRFGNAIFVSSDLRKKIIDQHPEEI